MLELTRLALVLSLVACGTVAAQHPPDTDDDPGVDASVPEPDAAPVGPVCSNLTFTQTPLIAEVNAAGQQDAVAGQSADGHTILTQRRAVCSGAFTLLVTDGVGSSQPITVDVTTLPGLVPMSTLESEVTITADGLSIVGVTTNLSGLAMATRSGRGGAIDFVATDGGFGAIVAPVGAQLHAPVLSSDRLALYYQLTNAGAGVDGIYESVRSSTQVPFPAATRMPDNIQTGGFITATSSDRLALFIETNFAMTVLTRARVTDPFTNPNAPNPPPSVPGFRVRPVGDCQTLIGTCTGGCLNEETCTITP